MKEPTQDLIGRLARDLAPIRVLPPIRVGLVGALLLWSLAFVSAAWLSQFELAQIARLATNGAWSGITLGLALAALAGCVAGLAAVVPGREEIVRRARWFGVGGLALAIGVAAQATFSGEVAQSVSLLRDASCFALGSFVGLAPGAALLAYAHRGYVLRPNGAAAHLLIGSFALGALSVQLLCDREAGRHMFLGHVSIPLLMLVFGALPLAAWLPRWQR